MFPKFLYLIGSAFCAQVASHSFFYYGQKMPLDARCTGIYLGFLGVFIFWLFKIRKKPNTIFPLLLLIPLSFSILYFIFDGISSIVFAAPWVANFTRLISGLLFGQALGILVFFILSHSFWGKETSSQTKKTKIISWPEYLILLAVNLIILVFFLSDFLPVFYLFTFLSILGLILCIFFVNFAILSTIFSKTIESKKIILGFTSFILTFLEFSFLIGLRNIVGA